MSDWISSCPSILDILKHVHHEDILSCQQVNRRLNQVIQRNLHMFPRPYAEVISKGEFAVEITMSDVYHQKSTISITHDGLVKLTSRHRKLTEEMLGLTSVNQCSSYHAVSTYNIYSRNRDEAIRLVLSVVFRIFFVELNIEVNSNFFDWTRKLYPLISDMFQRYVSGRSSFLHVSQENHGHGELEIGSYILKVGPFKAMSDLLPRFSFWKRDLKIVSMPNETNIFEPIAELVKKWRSGDCSIRNTEISFTERVKTTLTETNFMKLHEFMNSDVQTPLVRFGKIMITSVVRVLDNCRLDISFCSCFNKIQLCEGSSL